MAHRIGECLREPEADNIGEAVRIAERMAVLAVIVALGLLAVRQGRGLLSGCDGAEVTAYEILMAVTSQERHSYGAAFPRGRRARSV